MYFEKGSRDVFVPRNLMVDLEPGTIDCIKNGFFNPENFVCGNFGAGNSYARGKYTAGSKLLSPVVERVRKMAEACDSMQGFQVCHSIGGGSGSGIVKSVYL